MNQRMTKPTKWHVRPAKTQISLCIRSNWSESSLSGRMKKECVLSYPYSAMWRSWLSEHLNTSNMTLRKHAYSNTLKILPQKNGNFWIKNSDSFHISARNIDCGYPLEPPHRGGSNEYPQSMFLSRNNKNNVYPCKPQFYYIKVGFKGVKII